MNWKCSLSAQSKKNRNWFYWPTFLRFFWRVGLHLLNCSRTASNLNELFSLIISSELPVAGLYWTGAFWILKPFKTCHTSVAPWRVLLYVNFQAEESTGILELLNIFWPGEVYQMCLCFSEDDIPYTCFSQIDLLIRMFFRMLFITLELECFL